MARNHGVVDVMLASAAIVMVALQVMRLGALHDRPPVLEFETWRSEAAAALSLTGGSAGDHVLSEFVDFTCGVCASVHPLIDSASASMPWTIVIHHFPLNRPQSLPAAVAAECAAEQGAFPDMARVMYADQRNFGLRPWVRYAEEAGVSNLGQFEICMTRDPDDFPRIASGRTLGQRIGVRATPTIFLGRTKITPRQLSDSLSVRAHR